MVRNCLEFKFSLNLPSGCNFYLICQLTFCQGDCCTPDTSNVATALHSFAMMFFLSAHSLRQKILVPWTQWTDGPRNLVERVSRQEKHHDKENDNKEEN